jgi:hypothetical protein
MNEAVIDYRRKLASLAGRDKTIWELANRMMNEAISSEQAAIQDCWKSAERHNVASRKAQDELLDLLAGASASGEQGVVIERVKEAIGRSNLALMCWNEALSVAAKVALDAEHEDGDCACNKIAQTIISLKG